MTDREKVIKGLECCLGANDCDIEPEEDCPYKGMCLCAMALHLDVLALLKEQWIPVEKRMPDKPGTYLVSGGGEVWVCECLFLMGTKGWSNSAKRPRIEAWMPFPDPYAEGR